MTTEMFRAHRFGSDALEIIGLCNDIIEDYEQQGLSLTVRQLYYRMVADGHVENTMQSYKRISSILNKGRLAGLVSWEALVDRTRNYEEPTTWENPNGLMRSAVSSFNLDKWQSQHIQLEVWVEKEALSGVVSQVCDKHDIPWFACRGYVSQSWLWRAGKRVERRGWADKRTIILHLGDHDPSGIDMTRDNLSRVLELSNGGDVEVERIALNMAQVDKYAPPPNPAKTTDSRAKDYIANYGNSSWELDALEPSVIQSLISDKFYEYVDMDVWDETVAEQERMRGLIEEAGNWLKERL